MRGATITESSIHEMVDVFYHRIRQDPVLSPVFENILGQRWQQHMPRMYAFWTKVLLGKGTFDGNVFGKHMALKGIRPEHFTRWLGLFETSAVEVYGCTGAIGPVQVAKRIATSLQYGYFGEAAT